MKKLLRAFVKSLTAGGMDAAPHWFNLFHLLLVAVAGIAWLVSTVRGWL
ncbi:hypothetical protein [Cupriavidus basilensis]